ncbi:MAG: alpha-amylase family glycosyl hydrolase [Bacteroidota bacterium]
MYLKLYYILIAIFFVSHTSFAQKIDRVDPPNWWTGMKYNKIELLVHGKGISKAEFSTKESDISISKVILPENANYAYIEIDISENALAGIKFIDYKVGRKKYKLKYELKSRQKKAEEYRGISPSDLIYLITPDRFANGDTSNDKIKGMHDQEFDRNSDEARHGGDLKGIINKLNYIQSLGITSTWLNPVEENNQNRASYHGYGFTDHYNVDPRMGSNKDYADYVSESHKRNLKVIKDVVYNHFGINHYLIKDLPSKDWVHHWDEYTSSNYRATTLFDPHASEYDSKKMKNGWFDSSMPDMNQNNKHVANYLIQNSIWWIEEYGIDAYRIDTYYYSDQKFMGDLVKTLLEEYPDFSIFGETWVTGVPTQSWATKGPKNGKDFDSHMAGITDFNMQYALTDLVNEKNGWNTGISKIYYTLTWDYLYENPNANVIFLDNHDIDRFLGTVNGNLRDYRMALGVLLTTRGIPQLFYGAEINMDRGGHHGYLRQDFSGGWKEDKTDKFTTKGRSNDENSTWNYIAKLANWRKNSSAIANGKLIQFVPEDGIYVYFRYSDEQTVMVIVNNNQVEKTINTKRYSEKLKGFSKALDVISGDIIDFSGIKVEKRSTTILDLK